MIERGYPIAAEALDQELYRLLCVLSASASIHRQRTRYPALDRLRGTFEQSELSLRLIGVAVTLRSMLDAGVVGDRKGNAVVGSLIRIRDRRRRRAALSFREACNKIIHADLVEFYRGDGRQLTPVHPRIRLSGSKGSEEWLAELDARAFIKEGYECV